MEGVKTMQLNDQKAGMQGLNKEIINKIIFEASKGTPYFAFQEKRQKSIDAKVKELQSNIKKITEVQKKASLEKMTALGVVLESERNLNHSIVHIDMDAFYAAVEMQDDPNLAEKPMAVGSLSMLSTSNYHARKYGVRAAMPGFIAKKLCPELVIVPCNFTKYRKVSDKIRNIVKDYDPDYCGASLDEVYLDLTNYIKKKYKMKLHNGNCLRNYHENSASEGEFDAVIRIEENCEKCLRCCQIISVEERDAMAYEIVKEIRQKVYDSTQLTASAVGELPICLDLKKFVSELSDQNVSAVRRIKRCKAKLVNTKHTKTLLKPGKQTKLSKVLAIFRKDNIVGERASGGVSLLASLDYPSNSLPLITSLQVVAIQINLRTLVSVCSVYLPPNVHIDQRDLDSLIEQLPEPFVIIGDFNGHSLLWGNKDTNPRGRQIEIMIEDHSLCLLNNGKVTYFYEPTKTFHALDLAICSPSLLPFFTFDVGNDLHNSDNFSPLVSNPISRSPRFILEKADWQLFSSLAELTEEMVEGVEIDDAVKAVADKIM
ncbi:DNA polymerase kappa-like [Stegodyphus dumicola]|uniref:DNA polymerase kappa-like n=1 Tax=Stegodyphus dumicola TaxID=202533 RepID=UPI0015AF1553|nr:DNA polymerase kappa-like [Stegodyphus dumicola]